MALNIGIITEQKCYGCGLCKVTCAEGIIFKKNKDGYYKSYINEKNCINCGRCLKICPHSSQPDTINSVPSYVAYAKNRDFVLGSSSGGIAHVIASKYLDLGYAVIGAAWSEDFQRVEHIVVTDKKELVRLQKSKYVQSFTPEAFSQISKLDKVVVFGTPCQIAGLRNLYDERTGLVLVEIDCMGPAGLQLWDKYLAYLQRINNSGIKELKMRDKKHSWMVYGTKVNFNDGKEYFRDKYHDPFCVLYHLARLIQPACFSGCKYQNNSAADIRLGDAWSYTDTFTKEQIHDGLSLVTPITDTGKAIMRTIEDEIFVKKVERLPNKDYGSNADDRVWEIVRNPNASIEDAVAQYNDVGALKKLTRNVSYWLSYNDTLYLFIKRLLRAVRG